MADDTIPSGPAANDQTVTSILNDPLLQEAVWIVASENSASVSLLVDRMKIGGERAADLLRAMQTTLIIAPTGPGGSVQILFDLYETTIRPFVESAWVKVLNVTATFAKVADQAEIAARINAVWTKYDESVKVLCGKLEGDHRRAVEILFERERERQFQEYKANHAAFRQKVNAMPMPDDAIHGRSASHADNGQSVSEMVARTAVRASVWEAVRALFRL